MIFDSPGFGYNYGAPAPYYAPQPVRQQVQPRLQAPAKPQAAVVPAKPQVARVSVPTPEQLGIQLDVPPVVVPSPGELGINLE